MLLVFVAAAAVASCHKSSYRLYQFTGLDLQPATSAGGIPVATTDTVRCALFGIQLNLHPVEVDAKGKMEVYKTEIGNVNAVIGIRIWSDQPYNGIPAHGNLNTQFLHFRGSYFDVDSIGASGGITPTARNYPDYAQNPFPAYTQLIVKTPPAPGDYRFFVQLTLRDSTSFLDSTDIIHLVP